MRILPLWGGIPEKYVFWWNYEVLKEDSNYKVDFGKRILSDIFK